MLHTQNPLIYRTESASSMGWLQETRCTLLSGFATVVEMGHFQSLSPYKIDRQAGAKFALGQDDRVILVSSQNCQMIIVGDI